MLWFVRQGYRGLLCGFCFLGFDFGEPMFLPKTVMKTNVDFPWFGKFFFIGPSHWWDLWSAPEMGGDGLASFGCRCRLVWGGNGLPLPEVLLHFSV